MAHVGYDQSSSTRCRKHGRRAGALFVRPDADEGFPADYACAHCARDLGIQEGKVSREDAIRLLRQRLLLADVVSATMPEDFPKSIIKEAGRAALMAYEDPGNTEDLVFAVGFAALQVFREQRRLLARVGVRA